MAQRVVNGICSSSQSQDAAEAEFKPRIILTPQGQSPFYWVVT